MRKTISTLLCALVCASALQAETPQIAFRLLDDYVQKEQEKAIKGRVGSGVFAIVAGTVLVGAATATWFYGDQAYAAMSDGGTLNPGLKAGMSIGLAAGGGFCVWGGVNTLVSRPKDLKLRYMSVYGENDPEVQEAMAAATLRDMSDKGRNGRIGSIVTKLSVATLCIAASVGGSVAAGAPWYDDLSGIIFGQAWSVGSALGDIFSKSDGERLYEKYLAAREALYSTSGSPYRGPEGDGPDAAASAKED